MSTGGFHFLCSDSGSILKYFYDIWRLGPYLVVYDILIRTSLCRYRLKIQLGHSFFRSLLLSVFFFVSDKLLVYFFSRYRNISLFKVNSVVLPDSTDNLTVVILSLNHVTKTSRQPDTRIFLPLLQVRETKSSKSFNNIHIWVSLPL